MSTTSHPTSTAVDPALAANLYASGCLDRLIGEAVVPFQRRLLELDAAARLWAVRYSRRGEHLKLRVHTTAAPAAVETLLRESAERCFTDLPEAAGERVARADVPAIDPEDEAEGDAPDRSLARTTYRRSRVTLGHPEILGRDDLVGAMHRALAAGFERCLAGGGDGELARRRTSLLLTALSDGLGTVWPGDPTARGEYLAYHRDWLLRFFVTDPGKDQELRAHFAERVAAMAAAVAALRRAAQGGAGAPAGEDPGEDPWRRAVAELAEGTASLPQDLALDPFAPSPRYPVLFKVLHGVANSYGLRPLDEAFAHHLLGHALGTEP